MNLLDMVRGRTHRQNRVIGELQECVAELRRDLQTAHRYAARLEAQARAVNADQLAAENAELRAEVAVLRARRGVVSREELLRLQETNARLQSRLDALGAGRVTM
ncbi:hypothetical protein ACQP10_37930 (plasmid) [Streptosporangium sandarakinum]|uniref:hypothetical protein n=1 Tax=Streptosporangium sandarakinum TaxID=1260955 RepID=UPI003D89CAE1